MITDKELAELVIFLQAAKRSAYLADEHMITNVVNLTNRPTANRSNQTSISDIQRKL